MDEVFAAALQGHHPGGPELDVASRLEQPTHDSGHEDLPATGRVGDERRDDDGPPDEVAVVTDHQLRGVHARAYAHGVGRA